MTTPTTVQVRLQLRADTAANWTSINPVLLANELGRETDTGKIKIGNGSTAWNSLAYQAWATLPIAVNVGGTGQTTYTNGQLLIGNTTGNTLTKATLTAGSGIAITNGSGAITVAASGISDAQIAAGAEIAVSKLADGTPRQLLQTDAAGTGVEWASNIDIPGTLDVTSAATFDSSVAVTGALTKSGNNVVTVGDTGTVTSAMIANGTIVDDDISATAEIAVSKLADGAARQLLQTDAAGTGVEWANNIDVPGTLDVTGAATFDNNVVIQGDLTVNGTETIINTQTLEVEDKNIIVGKVTTPTDITADGGGITLKGTTDKTINWIDATDAWTLSEHVNIASAKEYRIAGTKVLDATSLGSGVTGSSLTSVGTIGTGVWQGTAINKTYLDNTLVSTGDTGTVTSTMIADGTIVDGDISASAAIVDTKLATISTAGKVSNSATTATDANTASAIVARDASGNFSAGTITANLSGNASTVTTNANLTGDVTSVGNATSIAAGVIVNADVNASAAIAGTKISPDFGSQNVTTTGTVTGASLIPTSSTAPTNGVYLPAANSVAISTGGSGRLFVDASGRVGVGATPAAANFEVSQSGTASASDVLRVYNRTDGTSTGYLGLPKFGSTASAYGPYSANNVGINAVFTQLNIGTETAHALAAYTNNTERLRITSTGALNFVGAGTAGSTQAVSFNGSAPVNSLVIDSSGRLGVGTSSPATTLDVNGTITCGTPGGVALSIAGGSAIRNLSAAASRMYFDTSFGSATHGSFEFRSSNAGTSRLVIDTSGNVGIGTSSPGALLDVNGNVGVGVPPNGTWGTAAIGLGKSGASNPTYPFIASTTSQDIWMGSNARWDGTNWKYQFSAASITAFALETAFNYFAINRAVAGSGGSNITWLPALKIDDTGRVGIGTTTVEVPLHVQRGGTAGEVLRLQNGGNAARLHFSTDTSSQVQSQNSNLYLNAYDNYPLLLGTNNTERARIDTSGRLLVGTSSARTNLYNSTTFAQVQVEGIGFQNAAISSIATGSLSYDSGSLILGKGRGAAIGANTAVQNNDILGYISFQGNDGTEFVEGGSIKVEVDGTPAQTSGDMPGRLVFSTTADGASSPTERMRITNGGFTKISVDGTQVNSAAYHELRTNNGSWTAYCSNTNASPYGVLITYPSAAPNGTSNEFLACSDSGTTRAAIRSNGGLANYQANDVNLSDINTKKDITPAAGTWDCIKEWEIVNYRYKDQPDDADLNLGVIAQQVAESCPEVITVFEEAKDDQPEKLGVKEQQMYWMAIKALQEAQARIETLEAKVAALETK